MKKVIDDVEKAYSVCIADGFVREKVVDVELAISLKEVAVKTLEFIERVSKILEKNSVDWTFVFRDYYESLRGLVEAYLLLEGIQVDNHQCKNAYICVKHPELELDWNFLEVIRLKRNAINYRGQLLNYTDWNLLKIQFGLHINTLKKAIEERVFSSEP